MATLEAVDHLERRSNHETSSGSRPGVRLLGGFGVTEAGNPVDIPASTWRVVAFVAMQHRPVGRTYLASCLWLDKSEDRAMANLRSALWRLRQCDVSLVKSSANHVWIDPHVTVDLTGWLVAARQLIDERVDCDLDTLDASQFSVELLPDWYDDFVELERERLRQLRLHALEGLSRRLLAGGRTARALDAALAAVAAEPLRESAHRAVIAVHLVEGNMAEAARQYRSLSCLLQQELGISPSARTLDMMESVLPAAVVERIGSSVRRYPRDEG